MMYDALQIDNLERDLLELPSPTPADVDSLLQSYHDKVSCFQEKNLFFY